MSTSSSSSSRSGNRRTVHGIPKKCWCGQSIDTWVSETKENPFRRFYRCKIARKNPTESHLFKWIDEAIIDEIQIVDAKRIDALHELQRLKDETKLALDSHISLLFAREQQLKQEVSDQFLQIYEAIDVLKREMNQKLDSHASFPVSTVTSPWKKFAASLAISGALSFLYWKVM